MPGMRTSSRIEVEGLALASAKRGGAVLDRGHLVAGARGSPSRGPSAGCPRRRRSGCAPFRHGSSASAGSMTRPCPSRARSRSGCAAMLLDDAVAERQPEAEPGSLVVKNGRKSLARVARDASPRPPPVPRRCSEAAAEVDLGEERVDAEARDQGQRPPPASPRSRCARGCGRPAPCGPRPPGWGAGSGRSAGRSVRRARPPSPPTSGRRARGAGGG